MSITINVSATMYDTTKAKSKCSTETGSCRLRLEFPNTHYVILTTPNHVRRFLFASNTIFSTNKQIPQTKPINLMQGNLVGWYVELSFVARVVTYIAILGTTLDNASTILSNFSFFCDLLCVNLQDLL